MRRMRASTPRALSKQLHLLEMQCDWGRAGPMPRPCKPTSPFRYFNSSPEIIRLAVLMYVRFPLSLRNVEDLLFERSIDICHETVRLKSLQKFASVHASLHNHFSHDRHLVDRQTYKTRRAVTLAEWQSLMA